MKSDADSLPILLMKNAKLTFDSRFFLRWTVQIRNTSNQLKQGINKMFTQYEITIERKPGQEKNPGDYLPETSVSRTLTKTVDSLKTHLTANRGIQKPALKRFYKSVDTNPCHHKGT